MSRMGLPFLAAWDSSFLHAVYVLVNAMSVYDKRKCPVVITVSIGAAISRSSPSLLTSSDDGSRDQMLEIK